MFSVWCLWFSVYGLWFRFGVEGSGVLAVDVLALPPEHRERQRRADVVVLRFGRLLIDGSG